MVDIEQILACLNRDQIRATYGAVGEVMGIPAIGVGRHLGESRAEASWIVSASSGKPSGYDPYALICLYIAGLYATGKEMVVFGDDEEGYIVVPVGR
jgi:hypothetical protein